MSYRLIGQDQLGLDPVPRSASSLDEIDGPVDWRPIEALQAPLQSLTQGEPAWTSLAMFKALVLSVWYEWTNVKLARALDHRASFHRFCGLARSERTP